MIRIKCDVMLTERELKSPRKSTRRVTATSTLKGKKTLSVKKVYDNTPEISVTRYYARGSDFPRDKIVADETNAVYKLRYI